MKSLFPFLKLMLLLLITMTTSLAVGCDSSGDDTNVTSNAKLVSNVTIPINTATSAGVTYTITGSGFEAGDKIELISQTNSLSADLTVASSTNASFVMPDGILDGIVYKFYLVRGSQSQLLGSTIVTITMVVDVVIPDSLTAEPNEKITILGVGFSTHDTIAIHFGETIYDVDIISFDSTSLTFEMPSEAIIGKGELVLTRDSEEQILSSILFSVAIPDAPNATVKGMVTAGGKGVEGVQVSDGDIFATTDSNGFYFLQSTKRNGIIFVINPVGYEAPVVKSEPQFWGKCTASATTCEQINFELIEAANTQYRLVVATDMHLANRNSDYYHFRDGFIAEMNDYSKTSDKRLFGLNLGDFSWDLYWYTNNWALPDCLNELNALDFPIYNIMGNHDNNPYISGDFSSEDAYRETMGPVYYSMNIGDIHYVMLDNTIYNNSNAAIGTVGDRNYDKYFSTEQIEWLKKDLSYITDKSTQIVLAAHIPLYSYSYINTTSVALSSQTAIDNILSCFDGFTNVDVVTGHTHVNRCVQSPTYTNVYEHNIAAICATWWWTLRYTDNNICTDGSPAGYKVFDVSGNDMTWRYKGVDFDEDKQFLTYDMNEVLEYWSTNSTAQSAFDSGYMSNRKNDYSGVSANTVYINVWGYEKSWSVEVFENGTPLNVSQVWKYDPLHTLCYDIPRSAAGSSLTFPSTYCMHMFAATASSPDSSLEIKVTDNFGRTYTESMSRPKAFTTTMK
ncbi:MAG: calcineurin-like phosphoesterase C-terminal domain-containing protein [Rikenellaceae bacterium]